ncbi:MAG TPA: peptidoglycan DD-metalloendopeptidase family protein [Candidatus Limnocylindria bacterium]|nr:peptidoglycan DD-metalloendopeptidase family protein [Candidatus Limnocylindria bacterium]
MLRTLRGIVLGFALLALFPASANAADPTPTPSPPPPSPPASPTPRATASPSPATSPVTSPSASPSASPSVSPSAGPSASPAGSASPSASPGSPSASPSASPAPSTSPAPEATPSPEELEAARARDAELLANAKSLKQIIEAQALVARDELAALNAEIARVGKDLEAVGSDIAALETQAADRRGIRERLTRDAFRLAAATATPSLASLSDAQIEAYRELLSIDASLRDAHGRLSERAAQLAEAQAAAGAKQGQLSRLRDRARTIAAAAEKGEGEKRAAEVAVLEALTRDAAAAQTVLAQLVANAMAGDGAAPSAWSLPVRGTITQPFGPTTFALEPPRVYQGVQYAHFHDAIDFAARLGQPVVAAAEGRVTFVGHLSDGAMVVIVAHAGGLVSVYAHLDDTFARPPVRIGDSVKANQVIGFVGLTGITTGPHLHFSVSRGGQPIDPLSLFGSR